MWRHNFLTKRNGLKLLNTARKIEEASYTAMVLAEGVMMASEARLAVELASADPVTMEASAAEVFSAQQAYQQSAQDYEMARQAVNLAQMMKAKL